MAILTCKDLRFSYDGVPVLEGVSYLELMRGNVTALKEALG